MAGRPALVVHKLTPSGSDVVLSDDSPGGARAAAAGPHGAHRVPCARPPAGALGYVSDEQRASPWPAGALRPALRAPRSDDGSAAAAEDSSPEVRRYVIPRLGASPAGPPPEEDSPAAARAGRTARRERRLARGRGAASPPVEPSSGTRGEDCLFAEGATTAQLTDATAAYEARLALRRPAAPRGARGARAHPTTILRQTTEVRRAATDLLAMLPAQARDTLLAGATVGVHISQEEADQALARALVNKSGTGGAALVEVMKTIAYLEGFAASRRSRLPSFTLWPMDAATAAMIVAAEHARATRASQQGQARGPHLRA